MAMKTSGEMIQEREERGQEEQTDGMMDGDRRDDGDGARDRWLIQTSDSVKSSHQRYDHN